MLFYYATIIRIENVGDLFCCRSILRQLTTRQSFNSIYLLLKFIYMDRDLNDKHFVFRFSTFSINDIYYDLNANITMSLTLLIA